MADPQDMILPMLKEIRAGIGDLGRNTDRQFEGVNGRLERMESRLANRREAVSGESVLGRCAAAGVEERLSALETAS